MAPERLDPTTAAGPVLSTGPVADAIVAAIRNENTDVRVTDRGSYLRVLVRGTCHVSRAGIEAILERPFVLPGDLERVMPSFQGRFSVSEDEASWWVPVSSPPESPSQTPPERT